jgi:hypothetical protein
LLPGAWRWNMKGIKGGRMEERMKQRNRNEKKRKRGK